MPITGLLTAVAATDAVHRSLTSRSLSVALVVTCTEACVWCGPPALQGGGVETEECQVERVVALVASRRVSHFLVDRHC